MHHGLASIDGNCLVSVQTRLLNDELQVQVVDNGDGMSKEKLEAVIKSLNELEEHEGDHIGLHNVNMRLKLSYGERYGLKLLLERLQLL